MKKIITKVELDGLSLEGDALNAARPQPVGGRKLSLGTSSRKELSLSMLGRLYAMVQWVTPQHKEVAALLEQGNQAAARPSLTTRSDRSTVPPHRKRSSIKFIKT